jgi:spermidine/putrescine transport system ATP-binding protein
MPGQLGLAIEGVGKRYGTLEVLDDISLHIPPQSYFVLLGPSGSGKTTLLSILGGFTPISSGRLMLDGEDITDQSPVVRPTTTVFQDYALFPHMNVSDNVGFGLRMRNRPADAIRAEVAAALALVGLDDLGSRRIDQLSGGQRHRVALARALVVKPKMLLLDEPLGALDMHLRWRMQDELWRLQRQTGAIFVHVTHDQEEAMNIGDSICVLNKGLIEDIGTPSRIYMQPATAFTAGFMGESNRVKARIVSSKDGETTLETPFGPLKTLKSTTAAESTAIFRPEHVRILEADKHANSMRVTISGHAFQGSHVKLYGRSLSDPTQEILIKIGAEDSFVDGAELAITVEPRHVGLFGTEP